MKARGRFVLACVLAAAVCAPAAGSAAKPKHSSTWQPHIAQARHYAKQRLGKVCFDVIGIDGRERGFNRKHRAPAASVFKVMLLATYLNRRSVRHRSLHQSDKHLLRPMIRRSDSVAATTVRNIVGVDAIERLANRAHMRDFAYNPIWGLSLTSPRDQAHFMLRFSHLVPPRHRAYALRQLARIVPSQRWGIGQAHTHGWSLFFKGGWGSGSGAVDHQVALLRGGHHHIAVAIFTQSDPSHGYGKKTLEGVAKRLLHGLPRPERV